MISVSISHVLTGVDMDCTTKASEPRTDSLNRTNTSPLANSYMSVGVGAIPSTVPISSARPGNPRPEKSIRVLRFSATMLFIGRLSSCPAVTELGPLHKDRPGESFPKRD